MSMSSVSRTQQAREVSRRLTLRLVTPVQRRASRAPFVVVVLGVVTSGLVGLILISTVLQAQAFQISSLRSQTRELSVTQQKLQGEVDALAAPANLAAEAIALGMVPNASPAFLRVGDGAIIGQPQPAEANTNVRGAAR